MSAATRWIIVIVGLLAVNMIAMIALAVIANDGDNQVIPAYYEHAVHHDQTIDEGRRSRALGWSAQATLTDGRVEVVLRDARGEALAGARVRVEGYQRAHAVDRIDVELEALGAGLYRAPLPVERSGWHDVTVIVERAGLRYVQHLVVEAS